MPTRWTTVAELEGKLRGRWERGMFLRSHAAGEPWVPVRLTVRHPSALDFRDDLDAVIAWADRFRRDSGEARGHPRFTVEHRALKGRGIGRNEVPSAVQFTSFAELVAFLGVDLDVARLDTILEATRTATPALVPWVTEHPMVALRHHAIWPELLATVNWIVEHDTTTLYLRHLDVPDVDTKFVESHQGVLTEMLARALPEERVDLGAADFAARFGFKSKPIYTRFRLLDAKGPYPPEISELRLRTDEFMAVEPPVSTVFVIENEISYLAFPDVADAIVVFGEGFHSATLERVSWLQRKQIVYWGDIDTHGFAILDRVRSRFPSVTSILMDQATLLAHPRQYGRERKPTSARLAHLTAPEAALYRDLVEDRFAPSLRLEQERIRFSFVRKALVPWGVASTSG